MNSILTVRPFTVPISSLMVNTSSNACVGWDPTPSPALMMGLRQWCAADYFKMEENTITITLNL